MNTDDEDAEEEKEEMTNLKVETNMAKANDVYKSDFKCRTPGIKKKKAKMYQEEL